MAKTSIAIENGAFYGVDAPGWIEGPSLHTNGNSPWPEYVAAEPGDLSEKRTWLPSFEDKEGPHVDWGFGLGYIKKPVEPEPAESSQLPETGEGAPGAVALLDPYSADSHPDSSADDFPEQPLPEKPADEPYVPTEPQGESTVHREADEANIPPVTEVLKEFFRETPERIKAFFRVEPEPPTSAGWIDASLGGREVEPRKIWWKDGDQEIATYAHKAMEDNYGDVYLEVPVGKTRRAIELKNAVFYVEPEEVHWLNRPAVDVCQEWWEKSRVFFNRMMAREASAEDKPVLNQLQTGEGLPALAQFEKAWIKDALDGKNVEPLDVTWQKREEDVPKEAVGAREKDGKIYLLIKVRGKKEEELGALPLEEAAFPVWGKDFWKSTPEDDYPEHLSDPRSDSGAGRAPGRMRDKVRAASQKIAERYSDRNIRPLDSFNEHGRSLRNWAARETRRSWYVATEYYYNSLDTVSAAADKARRYARQVSGR